MGSTKRKTTRLDFRVAAPIKELIEDAARSLGQTTSAFAVSTLTQEARKVIEEHAVIRLSDQARDRFLGMLDEDIEPNARLRRAAERHRRSVVE